MDSINLIFEFKYNLIMESVFMSQQGYNQRTQTEGVVKKEKAPLEDLFGTIIGSSIWNIIRMGLFPNAWWAILISIILGIAVFVNVIKTLSHLKEVFKYEYKTKAQDVIGGLIALIVVNTIFGVLFPGIWLAQIPMVAVSISFVKQIIELIINLSHGNSAKSQIENLQNVNLNTPINSTWATQVPPTPQTNASWRAPDQIHQQVVDQPGASQPQIGQSAILQPIVPNKAESTCPNCGFDKAENVKFCPACGYKY